MTTSNRWARALLVLAWLTCPVGAFQLYVDTIYAYQYQGTGKASDTLFVNSSSDTVVVDSIGGVPLLIPANDYYFSAVLEVLSSSGQLVGPNMPQVHCGDDSPACTCSMSPVHGFSIPPGCVLSEYGQVELSQANRCLGVLAKGMARADSGTVTIALRLKVYTSSGTDSVVVVSKSSGCSNVDPSRVSPPTRALTAAPSRIYTLRGRLIPGAMRAAGVFFVKPAGVAATGLKPTVSLR